MLQPLVCIRNPRAPRRGIHDEQNGREQAKHEDGPGQHVLGRELLDERRDDDGAHALHGLVQTGEDAHPLKRLGRAARGGRLVVVPVGGEGDDGAVEGFQAKLVDHDADGVDDDVPPLRRREVLQASEGLLDLSQRHGWMGLVG